VNVGRFSGRCEPKNYVPPIGENPNELIGTPDVDLGLIDMDERTLENPLEQQPFRLCIEPREILDEE
jgi:hypothetical protein